MTGRRLAIWLLASITELLQDPVPGREPQLSDWVADVVGGVLGFLIVVNLMVFTLAFFLDFFEIAFIVVPLLAPVAYKLGIDPVWFGVMLAVNMQTAFMHPPFGFALFYLKSVAPRSIRTADIYWGAIPFLVIQLLMVAVVLSVPQIVLRDPAPDASSVKEIPLEVDPDAYYLPLEWR